MATFSPLALDGDGSKHSICKHDDDPSDPLGSYTTAKTAREQMILSVVLGLSAFLVFCLLRPRWTGLYAARKKQKDAAAQLPELPNTFLGWIPVLYRITEEDVLASAGLDAFVFLRFFKLAIKFLAFVLFFVLTIILPVHAKFNPDPDPDDNKKGQKQGVVIVHDAHTESHKDKPSRDPFPADYLWIYVVFAYLFTAAAMYLIITETNHVIRVRQKYLSTHSTVKDRTIRLSGIPPHLRSEEAIKETIENLQIGRVENVTLCKNWHELDRLVDRRMNVLRKLEEAWTVYLGPRHSRRQLQTYRTEGNANADQTNVQESERLLHSNGDNHVDTSTTDANRPTTRLWYGRFRLRSKKIDAIDYYEEQLRRLDDSIRSAREKKFVPASLAFVTLDSIAACQMAIQAIIDPAPLQLIVNPAPAPEDVVWRNTYMSRRRRMTRAWIVTIIVALLTIVWWIIFIPLAGLLNIEAIGEVSPQLREFLCTHKEIASLVNTTLPTLILSLMLVLVPYLYDWLSNLQGMTSQGDAEMSVISKNFFFTFFNLFVSFTIFGTASKFYHGVGFEDWLDKLDPKEIMKNLAHSLAGLSGFYTNLVLLQAIGLSPFRLLEFGAVTLYPIGLMGSKTPRDYAELMYPPVFSYGFYLPQIQFVFLICVVYSVLKNSEVLLFFGLIYFIFSAFIYKYQLLYAMDHRHFSTGRAWIMICNRITVSLLVFQVTMGSQLALESAWRRSLLMIPLFVATVWFFIGYRRTYEPLMRFIALRSLRDAQVAHAELGTEIDASRQCHVHGLSASEAEDDASKAYVNPSMVMPLEDVWLSKTQAQRASFAINEEATNEPEV